MTTLSPRRAPYFVAGGTLGPHVPSYVKRPSDDELFEHVMMGELCYVLTPRQMGKSSLVARTIVRLKNENIGAANIDLQDSGGLDEDTFYLNILDELRRAFQLDVAVEEWWDENGRLGASLRFRRFFTDHLLPQVNNRVVIFIDEIDTMLTMPFRDNFFAAIRALFNGRASDPELERLTFVLLGVASPSELIKDPDRTPFNIGTKINLQEFEPTDAEPLLAGLAKEHPKQAKGILERIFHWTAGHPYLTQQLCLLITQSPERDWHDAMIDTLVRQTFLSDEARNEDNIRLIQSRISASPNKRRLLHLYRQVYRGKVIQENKASVEQNQLLLSGLVSLTDGQLQVRNQIYQNVFNQNWIRRETEINWGFWAVVSSLMILGAAISIVVFNLVIQPGRQRNYENEYIFAESLPTESAALGKLACMQPFLFGDSIDFDRRVSDLFFERESWEEQKSIYDYRHFKDHPQGLVCIVQDIYASMVDDDLSNSTTPMLQIMADNLRQIEHPDAEILIQELDFWITGREQLQQNNLDQALEAYSAAISINPNNPSTLFERARIYTILGNSISSTDSLNTSDQYNLALADLDRVVSFILLQPEPPETVMPEVITVTITAVSSSTTINTVPSTLTIATPSNPIGAPSPSPTATELPTLLPTPSHTPQPLLSQFYTRSQWLNLIRTFLLSEQPLANVLYLLDTENLESNFPNIANSGLIGTLLLLRSTPFPELGLGPTQYTVVAGDTLFGIAQGFNTTVNDIMVVNGLTSHIIIPGQVLNIPAPTTNATATITPLITPASTNTSLSNLVLTCTDNPPLIDGVFNPTEWTEKPLIEFLPPDNNTDLVQVYFVHDASNLYLTVLINDPTIDASDAVRLFFDTTGDRGDPDTSDRFFFVGRDGTALVQSGIGSNSDGIIWDTNYTSSNWTAVLGSQPGQWVVEMQIDASAEMASLANPFGMMVQVLYTGDLAVWPEGGGSNSPSTWQFVNNVSCP